MNDPYTLSLVEVEPVGPLHFVEVKWSRGPIGVVAVKRGNTLKDVRIDLGKQVFIDDIKAMFADGGAFRAPLTVLRSRARQIAEKVRKNRKPEELLALLHG